MKMTIRSTFSIGEDDGGGSNNPWTDWNVNDTIEAILAECSLATVNRESCNADKT